MNSLHFYIKDSTKMRQKLYKNVYCTFHRKSCLQVKDCLDYDHK